MKKILTFVLMISAVPFAHSCDIKDSQCASQLARSYSQLSNEMWILRQCKETSCQSTHSEKADRVSAEIARLQSKR